MQRAKQDQQAQSSGPVAEDSMKPSVAPKTLSLPPLKESAFDKSSAGRTDVSFSSSKPDMVKPASVKPPSRDSARIVNTEKPLLEKKEEKPIIPLKRNITPIEPESSSGIKSESTTTPSIHVQGEAVHQSKDSVSPESKVEAKPPGLKTKPETPPKVDFRASLKSRQAASTDNNDAQPEFKAIFGKLKRAQTQNYVAPDLLKDNISKGKAALSTTGGPQKTKRVDDFKESILQKKEAMKAGGGSTAKRPELTTPTEKSDEPIPEALARRMTLQKKGALNDKLESAAIDVPLKPRVLASKPQTAPAKLHPTVQSSKQSVLAPKPQSESEKPNPVKHTILPSPERRPAPVQSPPASQTETPDPVTTTALPLKPKPAERTQIDQPKPETTSSEVTPPVEPSLETKLTKKLSENSKLAARLNPALASMISRSGSPKAAGEGLSDGGSAVQVRDSSQLSRESTREESADLTHMTKARAKGPKRRAPKTGASSKEASTPATQPAPKSMPASAPRASSPEPLPDPKAVLSMRSFTAKPTYNKPKVLQGTEPEVAELKRPLPMPPKPVVQDPSAEPPVGEKASADSKSTSRSEPDPKTKPIIVSKSSEVRKVSSSATLSKGPEEPAPLKPKKSADLRTVPTPSMPSKPDDEPAPVKPFTPKKFGVLSDLPKSVSSPPESDGDKKYESLPPPPTPNMPLTPSKSKLNTPKAPKPDVNSLTKPRSVTPSKASGLGLQLGSAFKKSAAAPVLTPPPEPEVATARMAASPRKLMSPTKPSPSIRPRLESFFGILPQAREKAEFDTHAFLSAQNNAGQKSKTLNKQIWEVSGDGKRTPMPPQQDHILFEDSMYLCVHSMQSSAGSKSTEVYLWCGDEVPEAAVEDAQLFCRKVARENSAKLEVVKQGKESSEFFQALGGIVIVRRNKSSALYMLCGRRHLGHVAFDEVDLVADSLCSGLPFLISAKFGKLYLWKGAGSDQEDVGCARLIGMDLGLTGEIEEISEGKEPASFWESFPPQSIKPAKTHSRNQEKQLHNHAPRLYRVEHDRPKSSGGFWGLRTSSPPKQPIRALVDEITPFSQRDLDPNQIHILDTYGELHM